MEIYNLYLSSSILSIFFISLLLYIINIMQNKIKQSNSMAFNFDYKYLFWPNMFFN